MPNKDGTGPEGKGPKTGRQLGNCKNEESQESATKAGRGLGPCGQGLRRSFGRGLRKGFGFRRKFQNRR